MRDNIPCVVCGKEIKPLDMNHTNGLPMQIMWNDGIVDLFEGGYGSKHDLTSFVAGICDVCVDKALEEGRISIFDQH